MSAEFSADFFDGRTSRRHAVSVGVFGDSVAIRGDDVAFNVPRAQADVQPRLGSAPVRIVLPDGGLLVARDADAVEASLGIPRLRTLAHRLESNAAVLAVALLGIVVGGWFAYSDGIPWVSRKVAEHISPKVETQLANESLKAADGLIFQPSKLEPARRDAIVGEFAALVARADLAQPVHLEFRASQFLKANAVTLPGGIIVVTDELVELMDDREVAAVLAHELGHVRHRHGLRHLLNNSMHALIVMAVFGDVSAVGTAAVLVPTVFMNTGYSRGFEREADAYAWDLLQRTGRSPLDFAHALDILRREASGKSKRDFGYLKTHPDIEERMEAAEDAAKKGNAARK